jgi:D-ribulokinase
VEIMGVEERNSSFMGAYVCGIDIGISGVRVIVLRKDGFVSSRSFVSLPPTDRGEGKSTQDPFVWWGCVVEALQEAMNSLAIVGGSAKEVSAICIDATSGTILPVDKDLMPLGPGIVYNDARSHKEAEYLNRIGFDCIKELGYRFDSRFALPKILYLKNHAPKIWGNTRYILHQADFIVTRLLGKNGEVLTDTSNALKTGYDILNFQWPKYMQDIGIADKMPGVVKTGTPLGVVDGEVASLFGFSDNVELIAGMTDSVAACVASGAKKEGDMNTILGSTITWKVLAGNVIKDEYGRIYSHLHPSGCYLPGGVGNSGGYGIRSMMDASPEELTLYATNLDINKPSDFFAYPLPAQGERYPFIDENFQSFISKEKGKGEVLYKALIEGAACVERWGYETLNGLQANINGDVWTTGGGAMVDSWMKIRANILNRVVLRTRFPESAFGASLIAAMASWFRGDFEKTSESFVIEMAKFEPTPELTKKYDEYYYSFREKVEMFKKLKGRN